MTSVVREALAACEYLLPWFPPFVSWVEVLRILRHSWDLILSDLDLGQMPAKEEVGRPLLT